MPVVGIGSEGVEAKVPFLFLGTMAFEAVVFEESLRRGAREGERGEEEENGAGQGHGDITGGNSKSVQMRS